MAEPESPGSLFCGVIASASSDAEVRSFRNGDQNLAKFAINSWICGIVAQEILSPKLYRDSAENIVKIVRFIRHKSIPACLLCQRLQIYLPLTANFIQSDGGSSRIDGIKDGIGALYRKQYLGEIMLASVVFSIG